MPGMSDTMAYSWGAPTTRRRHPQTARMEDLLRMIEPSQSGPDDLPDHLREEIETVNEKDAVTR